jgi:hypothetical protein
MSLLMDERRRSRLAVVALTCLVGFVAMTLLMRAGVTAGIDLWALEPSRIAAPVAAGGPSPIWPTSSWCS